MKTETSRKIKNGEGKNNSGCNKYYLQYVYHIRVPQKSIFLLNSKPLTCLQSFKWVYLVALYSIQSLFETHVQIPAGVEIFSTFL